jgi:MYXO-CTERM domain-containing protein
MKAMLRRSVGSLVASAALLLAPVALAEGEACFNDVDCPGGGAACGGDVCNWSKTTANPVGEKIFYCNPAGSQPKANDGWCTKANGDADCKCKAEGAKCVGNFCTFTKPSDAPGAGGSGTAGSGTGGSGTAGTGTGGTGTGGSTGGSAGAGTAGAATAGTGATTPEDDGGCSVSAARAGTSVTALALGLLGLGAMVARRRRAA